MLISRISGCKDRAFNGGGKIFKVFFVQLLSSLYYQMPFFHLFYFSFSKILLCFLYFLLCPLQRIRGLEDFIFQQRRIIRMSVQKTFHFPIGRFAPVGSQ